MRLVSSGNLTCRDLSFEDVWCWRCKAPPGRACTTRNGKRAEPHKARENRARQIHKVAFPLRPGEIEHLRQYLPAHVLAQADREET
jgi:hypothetical protein